jgi:hypothetical protein
MKIILSVFFCFCFSCVWGQQQLENEISKLNRTNSALKNSIVTLQKERYALIKRDSLIKCSLKIYSDSISDCKTKIKFANGKKLTLDTLKNNINICIQKKITDMSDIDTKEKILQETQNKYTDCQNKFKSSAGQIKFDTEKLENEISKLSLIKSDLLKSQLDFNKQEEKFILLRNNFLKQVNEDYLFGNYRLKQIEILKDTGEYKERLKHYANAFDYFSKLNVFFNKPYDAGMYKSITNMNLNVDSFDKKIQDKLSVIKFAFDDYGRVYCSYVNEFNTKIDNLQMKKYNYLSINEMNAFFVSSYIDLNMHYRFISTDITMKTKKKLEDLKKIEANGCN